MSKNRKTLKKAIVVLGMHRSGTSALAGVLSKLGATMPKTLEPANPANPRGYWESRLLMRANEDLLRASGSRWDDWRRFDPMWAETAQGKAHVRRVAKAVAEEFEGDHLSVVKDPRICRFFPTFRTVLADAGWEAVVLLPVRSPFEVAQSIKTRDHSNLAPSLLLWLRHVLDAENSSRDVPRAVILYDSLLNDWRPELDRAIAATGIDGLTMSDANVAEVQNFLSKDLRRETVSPALRSSAPDGLAALAIQVYELLSKLAGQDAEKAPTTLEELDECRRAFDAACDIFETPMLEANEKVQHSQRMSREIARSYDELLHVFGTGGEIPPRSIVDEEEAARNLAANSTMIISTYAKIIAEKDKLRDDVAGLSEERAQLQSQVEASATATQESQTAVAALQAARDAAAAELDALTAANRTLQERNAAVVTELDALSGAHHELATAQRQGRDTIRSLQKKQQTLTRQSSHLTEQLERAKAERSKILKSASWRATAPFRRVKRALSPKTS